MFPVVLALQTLVAVQAIQAVAFVLAVLYLARRLRFEAAESRRNSRDQMQALAAELGRLSITVRAARAESGTFLEAVFSGVRGMARNLDAARVTSAETLDELRRRFEPPAVPADASVIESPVEPAREVEADRPGRTLHEARLAEMVRLREAQARRRGRGQAG